MTPGRRALVGAGIVCGLLLVTAFNATNAAGQAMPTLYFVPVIFAALFFGFGGGMTCATIAALLCGWGVMRREAELRANDIMTICFYFIFASLLAKTMEDQQLIRRLAVTDQLTGLFNRRFLFHTIEQEFTRAQRYARPLSLLMFDLDLFKKYNDLYGHLRGDALLAQLASLVRDGFRKTDIIGRYGGEEFAVLLPEAAEDNALLAAERVRLMVEKSLRGPFPVTVSIGVASVIPSMKIMDDLIDRADTALYCAKRDGRNCVRRFGEGLDAVKPLAAVAAGGR